MRIGLELYTADLLCFLNSSYLSDTYYQYACDNCDTDRLAGKLYANSFLLAIYDVLHVVAATKPNKHTCEGV